MRMVFGIILVVVILGATFIAWYSLAAVALALP